MADLVKVLWRDVLDEAVDEVQHAVTGDLLLPAVAVVGVQEVYVSAVVADDAHLPDDGSARVSAAIAHGAIDLGETWTDMDPPALLADADQQGLDLGRVVRVPAVRGVDQGPVLLGLSDCFDDVLLPLPREVVRTEQGVRRSIDPSLVIRREATCSDQRMDVGIESEVAAERVADEHDAGKEQAALARHALAVLAGLRLGSPGGQ